MRTRGLTLLSGRARPAWPSAATWLALLLLLFAWAPLTYPGYFELHSGFSPVFNLTDWLRHIGELGWVPEVGRPYDLWRGENVLPYLAALLPQALGAAPVSAVKWVFGASLLAGGLGMYAWARRRLGAWPGLMAAAVYVYWPVGLATVYVRGAYAEAFLLGLLPWLAWAADSAADGGWRRVLLLAFGLAAALWTQAGLALWEAGITLVYVLAVARSANGSARSIVKPLAGWLGGIGLGALGLAPIILQRGLGGTPHLLFADHFVYPHQLLSAGWGTGPSVAGPYDTLTFSLGLVACGLALLGWLAPRPAADGAPPASTPSDLRILNTTATVATLAVLALALASTTLAGPLWRLMPSLARTLTYPWQLLLLAGPWLAYLAGLGVRRLVRLLPQEDREAGTTAVIAALSVLALLGVYEDLHPVATSAPVPDAPLAIYGDNEIALLSAQVTGSPRPGGLITLEVRWQALRPLAQDYTAFFHAMGPDGKRHGQQDTMPLNGDLPTSLWRPGQVVADRYELQLAPDAPSGDYRYWLGWYSLASGQRLSAGVDDKAVLTP